MKLRTIKIRNFRCYRDEVSIDVGDLTSLIGKNDVGKSTIFDALSIFFDVTKPDQDDASKDGDPRDMTITCEFDDLPDSLVLDASNKTSLSAEYLLNTNGRLEICRVFNGSLKTPSASNFINATHPTADGAADLLSLKNADLKTRATEQGVDLSGVNQRVNAELRAAIWAHAGDLELQEKLIEVDTQPGAKELYGKIKEAMPAFFLFKSDRASTDQDSEAQDPMKVAVRLAIEQQKESLDAIAQLVRTQVAELVTQTISKIEAMSPEIARQLQPQISEPKWDSVFKIALTGDSAIPLNKRGSGVRRLVLLGFLQAQAESKRLASPDSGVIYAIEEPETSQHPDQQRALLQALEEIAEQDGYQVLVTTHTPMLGRLLPESTLRYISSDEGVRTIHEPSETTMGLIAKALGVLPDHDVKVFVGIEGKHDESFLKIISSTLSTSDDLIDDLSVLETDGKLIFVPGGGSSVGLWVSRLHGLNRPEFHIFDRDNQPPADPHYKSEADEINLLSDCEAVHTSKAELENYLHPDAIKLARAEVVLATIDDFDDVPLLVAQAVHTAADASNPWAEIDDDKRRKKMSRAKVWLNTEAVEQMTEAMLGQSDPNGDVVSWLRRITKLARS